MNCVLAADLAIVSVGRSRRCKTECCGCGNNHGLHDLSPHLPASLERVRGLFHRIAAMAGR